MSEVDDDVKLITDFLNKPEVDVPELRKDITVHSNVRWLLNNLGIRNGGISGYREVKFALLKMLRVAAREPDDGFQEP